MIETRTAGAGDVPAIVALLNAAFAMERAFIDKDRTSAEEIARYMGTGTFFVVGARTARSASSTTAPNRSWSRSSRSPRTFSA